MSSTNLAEKEDPGYFPAGSKEVYNSEEVTLKAITWVGKKNEDSLSLRSQPSRLCVSLGV